MNAAAFRRLLKHKVTIQRQSTAKNDITGAETESWAEVSTDVPALIQPLSSKQLLKVQGLHLVATFAGFFMFAEDVQLRDKVILEGKTYFVEGVESGWSGGQDHKETYLRAMEEQKNG